MNPFLLLGWIATAEGLRLHSFFTPGMMMQRDVPTKIWGYDLVGSLEAHLICQVGGNTVTHKLVTVGSNDGVWETELPSQPAATVCDLQATSETEDLVLTDIMFGDIWFCSGQSNMEMAMEYIMNSTEEIKASASFTTIRYAVIKNTVSTTPDLDADLPLEQSSMDVRSLLSLRSLPAAAVASIR